MYIIFKKKLYLPAAVALIMLTLSLSNVSYASVGCKNLQSVAVNDENLKYLRSWISDVLDDPKIIRLFGRHGTLKTGESPFIMDRLNLDFKKAGLDPRFSGVTLNRVDTDFYTSFDIIESVSFWEGRDYLMVNTNNGFDVINNLHKYRGIHSNWNRKLISDGVILFCR